MSIFNIRYFTYFTLLSLSSFLLIWSGRGLSGLYIILFFILILIIFFITNLKINSYLFPIRNDLKVNLTTEFVSLVLLFILWLSITDFYLIEMLKHLDYQFTENTYWVVLFGGFAPMNLLIIAVAYFLGSRSFAGLLRLIIFSVFILNSNLNDLLYYLLFNESFPIYWTWIHQPVFIFGENIQTWQLTLWSLLCCILGMITLILPYSQFSPYFKDGNSNLNNDKSFQIISLITVSIVCFVGSILAYITILEIQTSLSKYKNTNTTIEVTQKIDSLKLEASSTYNIILAERLKILSESINTLDNIYKQRGSYPISTGNCMEDWDSSFINLPFKVNNNEVIDPEQSKAKTCDFSQNSKNILYYSNGSKYALIADGSLIITYKNEYPNLYIPNQRDVRWFYEDTYFYKDWSWNYPFLVYMFEKGNEITQFKEL